MREWILTKFGGQMALRTGTTWLNFKVKVKCHSVWGKVGWLRQLNSKQTQVCLF